MKKLIELHKIIEKEGILLEHLEFEDSIILGVYFKHEDLSIIGIRKSIISNEKLYKCVLAEELGHHFTSYNFIQTEGFSYSNKIMLCKNELMARRWAVNFLLPDAAYLKALSNGIISLADFFGVTEEYIMLKNETLILQNKISRGYATGRKELMHGVFYTL